MIQLCLIITRWRVIMMPAMGREKAVQIVVITPAVVTSVTVYVVVLVVANALVAPKVVVQKN